MPRPLRDVADVLRAHGMRVTAPRIAVVDAIRGSGTPARGTCVPDDRHHTICRSCGATRDVDCATGHAPRPAPSARGGFVVDGAEVTPGGVGAVCAQTAATRPTTGGTPRATTRTPHDPPGPARPRQREPADDGPSRPRRR